MQIRCLLPLALLLCALPACASTWFVRADGGTRYSANVPAGHCNGQANAPDPGSGTNQPCAFSQLQFMWDDFSGLGAPSLGWVSAPGDTVEIFGCAPLGTNAVTGPCRMGWINPTSSAFGDPAPCYAVGSYGCSNPQIPDNTTILGACAAGVYSCNPAKVWPYTSNLTQIFMGFSLQSGLVLSGCHGCTIKGIELTTHNQHWNGSAWSGNCTRNGSPSYPVGCANNQPLDDYADNCLTTSATTTNLTLQDVYIDGCSGSGIIGPIGVGTVATRVLFAFNAQAGWNFDDGNSGPNGTGATMTASYVDFVGQGCYEEYPITHSQWPARACYDSASNGFGDTWSGQGHTFVTQWAAFSWDHGLCEYNSKDCGLGPEALVHNLTVTNLLSYGNMGAQVKFSTDAGSNNLFQNLLIGGNCSRMSALLPGAAQSFNVGTGLGGSYLSNFCRAAGDQFPYSTNSGSTTLFNSITMFVTGATIFDLSCIVANNCDTASLMFQNMVMLGYTAPVSEAPGLFYHTDSSIHVVSGHNVEYGIRNGSTPGPTIITTDPFLTGEPVQGSWPPESALDALVSGGSYPCVVEAESCLGASPAIAAGLATGGWTADYYGVTRPNPPSIGAVEPAGTPSPDGGSVLTGDISVSIIIK
jgi:hypothetical protein